MRIASNYVALAFVAAVGCSSSKPLNNAQPSGRIPGATDLGRVAPDSTYDFVIGIEAQNRPAMQKFLDSMDRTGETMGATDFADSFVVSAAEYKRVVNWLQSQGLQVTRTVSGRSTITVHATGAAIDRAFGAELHDYSDANGKFTASVNGFTISPEVSGSISGLTGGIDGSLPWFSHMRRVEGAGSGTAHPDAIPVGTGFHGGYQAPQLEAMYKTNTIVNPGKGEIVVILGAAAPALTADIAAYFTASKPYGLSAPVGKYMLDTFDGDLPAQDPGFGGENTLDVEMVSAMAPYADIYHVLTPSAGQEFFVDGVAHIVDTYTQPGKQAVAVTVSYGSCERGGGQAIPIMNVMLAQAKAAGQQWFFSSGDDGTNTCRNGDGNTIVSADFPADIIYALGVGGTELSTNTTTQTVPASGEIVWNENGNPTPATFGEPFGGAGGGGVSTLVLKPAFQTGVGPGASDGARDIPDVSALGGSPGVEIWQTNPQTNQPQVNLVAGTSAASPMWAGMWAIIAQAKGVTSINNGAEQLYKIGATGKGFFDITFGNNGGPGNQPTGGYPAVAGYDMATGWGSPNVPELIAAWQ
jgi:subtilase family serine protease